MFRSRIGLTWRGLAATTVAALAVVALAGGALAQVSEEAAKTYTGCLIGPDGRPGTIQLLTEGDRPRTGVCPAGSKLIRLSSGDITAVAAGAGLVGGGTNGVVQLSLRTDCGSGQVLKWNGSTWACSSDTDTQYSAGTGLDLNGAEFSVEPDAFAKKNQACASGQFARGVDAGGGLTCAGAPAPASYYADQPSLDKTIPDDEGFHVVISLQLPAGKYAVSGSGTIAADTTGGTSEGACYLHRGETQGYYDDDGSLYGATIALNAVLTLASAQTVAVECIAVDDHDQAVARDFEIVAVSVS